MIEPQDLRKAVQTGLITEMQASGLTALADARRQARDSVTPGEEPFVLFKGFNEIFIVIGLSVLFGAWISFAFVSSFSITGASGPKFMLMSVITLIGLFVVQNYFTLKRRMIAPSMALAIMFAISLWTTAGTAIELFFTPTSELPYAGVWAMVAAGMMLHYRRYHVPFSAAIIAGALFGMVWTVLVARRLVPDDTMAIMQFTGTGQMGGLSILFGLLCFGVAMRFDMLDPHRVSTRAATGFWLHVVAAPAILNPIAINLLERGSAGQISLLVILCGLAVLAMAIDRRSFLVSGVGYAVWLLGALFDGSLLVILLLGLGLVFLGAQWEHLRRALMTALPDFPGKDRLPPYGSLK